jgi:hypothetical protein
MHYAMQMYFANGGGPCYIVSVGKLQYIYPEGELVDLKKVLLLLKKKTNQLLLFSRMLKQYLQKLMVYMDWL